MMRVVSISCVYPSPLQPTLGTFVRARLSRLARQVELKVVAPVALVEYGNAARRKTAAQALPFLSIEDGMEVMRPRWFYPPLGGAMNAAFLGARLLPLLRKMHREFPFQLIDAHFAYPDGIAAAMVARALGTPYSITLRGNEPMHAGYPARGKAIRWAIRNATQIIAVSSRLADFAVSCGAAPGRVRTIPNGVDTSIFYPHPAGDAFQQYQVPAGLPVILSAGYLIERKGHHHVMQALAGLRNTGSPAHLVIAGGGGAEGDYEQHLRSLAKTLQLEDIVHFTGAVPPATLAAFMSEASVVCLASSREGWPNVVNEALACGTPVVATDIGGVPDMISSPGLGTVLPSSSPDAIQAALQDALARSWNRSEIAAWGMSRSWEQVAKEVQDTFRQAVNREKSA